MKTLIVYDSVYGDTEQIARAIVRAITSAGEVKIFRAGEVNLPELESTDLLIVGSPTRGFRPTESVQTFIKGIPKGALKGISVAAFDTRFPTSEAKTVLRLIMKVGGYAAGRNYESFGASGWIKLADFSII